MSVPSLQIGSRTVGCEHPPLVIAELSGNHNQSLDRALQLVDAAAEAGAHAVKLQTYTADTMTIPLTTGPFRIDDGGSLWKGRTLHDLYREAHTPWEWHAPIFERCRARGLLAFSTPFDASAVDFLETLDVPAYKIASFENTDLPLIARVAATGKPVIVSTGMALVGEIEEVVSTMRANGNDRLVLLKCTSNYPASPANSNLRTIAHLRELFGVQVGLSDHTLGIGVSLAAVAFGATVIEKHFTLRRSDGGVDAAFSLEPTELRDLVVETERAWQSLGTVSYGPTSDERRSLQFRRSLYVTKAIKAGTVFSSENVRAIRPGGGLAPKFIEKVLGRRCARDVEAGTPISWELLG